MPPYQFVVGVNLAALESEVNRIADERGVRLNQVFYAHGTGFVGVLEHAGRADHAREPEPARGDQGHRRGEPEHGRSSPKPGSSRSKKP